MKRSAVGGLGAEWLGHICSRTLAPMLRLVLTLSLALLCVWQSDFNAETQFSRLRNDSAYKLSCGLARSLANPQTHIKISPLAFVSETLPTLKHSMKYPRPLLCRNFLFQYRLGSHYLSQEQKCVLIRLPTLFNGWVMIAQSTLLSVPKLWQSLLEGTRDRDT